jgi:hypothetical protein
VKGDIEKLKNGLMMKMKEIILLEACFNGEALLKRPKTILCVDDSMIS